MHQLSRQPPPAILRWPTGGLTSSQPSFSLSPWSSLTFSISLLPITPRNTTSTWPSFLFRRWHLRPPITVAPSPLLSSTTGLLLPISLCLSCRFPLSTSLGQTIEPQQWQSRPLGFGVLSVGRKKEGGGIFFQTRCTHELSGYASSAPQFSFNCNLA